MTTDIIKAAAEKGAWNMSFKMPKFKHASNLPNDLGKLGSKNGRFNQ
jgi:hypothetical protein